MSGIHSIPNDLLVQIFSNVPEQDLVNLPLVCKNWNVAHKALFKSYWNELKKKTDAPDSLKQRILVLNPTEGQYATSFYKLYGHTQNELLWQGGKQELQEINQKHQGFLNPQKLIDLEEKKIDLKAVNCLSLREENVSDCSYAWIVSEFRGIPEEMVKLNLRDLIFSNNNITCIPPYISELKNVQTLSFYKNKIEQLPKELSELPSLTRLDLSENPLKEFPRHMGKLFNRSCFTLILDKENFLKFGKEIEKAIQENTSIWTKILGYTIWCLAIPIGFFVFLLKMICCCSHLPISDLSREQIAELTESNISISTSALVYYATFGRFRIHINED